MAYSATTAADAAAEHCFSRLPFVLRAALYLLPWCLLAALRFGGPPQEIGAWMPNLQLGKRAARDMEPFEATRVTFLQHFLNSSSDKKIHFYGPAYNQYFDSIKDKKLAMLEIGLRGGQSIDLWKTWFTDLTLYGVDNGGESTVFTKYIATDPRVRIYIGDQANVTFLQEISEKIHTEEGALDILIDDGGHTMNQQLTSFTHLFPLIRPGGMYFIEDLETSYYPNYGGGALGMQGTMIDTIKSFIDVLNERYILSGESAMHGKLAVYTVNPVDHQISSIQCWPNLCCIFKKDMK